MPRSFVIIKFYSHTRKIDFSFEGIVPPKVSWLREQFFETFKDVIPEGITRKYILFQRYDKSIKEWLDLSDEEYVHPEDIIKADIEQVPEVPHPIKDAKIYRLWSSSSRTGGSLLKMEKSSNILKCDGLNSQDCSVLNILFHDESTPSKVLYRLQFVDGTGNKWLVTGQGEGKEVKIQQYTGQTVQDSQKFEPYYFFGHTRLRCHSVGGRDDLYLSSDGLGKVTLIQGGPLAYPVAQTLFITNEQ
ncbi:uncharacterized protein LOC116618429 isoform X1 [Nematostella vectensis]|uniref:uncharacterized protein LOC116618429 isoform X1 n=1 Tax=Nematostella vectensis TaxID=45351 RepID=UPI002077526B|nr:uncharacterized protein LOC116618429 isoform X1 [Nematostella vectensis]